MATSKSRLGRGLGGLISTGGSGKASGAGDGAEEAATPEPAENSRDAHTNAAKKGTKKAAKKAAKQADASTPPVSQIPGYEEIPVASVKPNPYQPRREINEEQVEELAQSIRAEGLLQPVVVREKGGGYELIAGERRLRAFERLERKRIPARIIEASDASSAALSLIENLQRENLNPIDEAMGYASLLRDFDLTQEGAAERVGKGRATVANALRLLTLPTEIQNYLSRRLLSTGHAKALLGVESGEHRQMLARRIIETGMSVREAELQVRRLDKKGGKGGSSAARAKEAEQTAIRDLEKRVGEHFNTRVSVKHSTKRGKLTIEYFGNEDLERILQKMGIPS
ncbi:MAG: ParB/RepB/Spo0J family partition protein [Opitutales bacterium]